MKYLYSSLYTAFAFFLLSYLVACTPAAPMKDAGKPPNIIMIMADDLGYETIGANGGTSYDTPEIDRIAANGMRFEHAYAQPLCTPTRVKLMTGIYNVRNYVNFGLLPTSQTTFAHLFQNAGYATCITGKWQLGIDPESPDQAGFDHHSLWQVGGGRTDSTGRDTRFAGPVLQTDGKLTSYPLSEYGPEIVSDFALDFMEASQEEGKPFLLYYPMILTHCPFSPTPHSPEWMKDDTTIMTYKGQPHYFEDMVSEMDRIVGKINRKLEELGIRENTLLIFTGDNGTDEPIVSMLDGREVAGAKGETTDAGTRVPLVVQWPGVVEPNTVSSDLIDFSDFMPTICEAAGIPVPESLDIDGRSFLPQLKGEEGVPREWIYCWFSRNGVDEQAQVFARNQRYKLYESGGFYDIELDPDEKRPITKMGETMQETHDMLKGVLDSYSARRLEDIPD